MQNSCSWFDVSFEAKCRVSFRSKGELTRFNHVHESKFFVHKDPSSWTSEITASVNFFSDVIWQGMKWLVEALELMDTNREGGNSQED